DGVGIWADPLHLVGDIGRYHHGFGFDQQGVRAQGTWRGFDGTFLYADNFEIGDPNTPALDSRDVSTPGLNYDFNRSATNKNVFAARLERQLRRGFRLGVSLRNDRGYNPGALSQVVVVGDSTRRREQFPSTSERWLGGGADLHWRSTDEAWEVFGEILYGEAWVSAGQGTLQVFRASDSQFELVEQRLMEGDDVSVDLSSRWTLGLRTGRIRDLQLHVAFERERHGLTSVATDSLISLRNTAFVYRAGFGLGLQGRFGLPLRLGVDLETFDFSYPVQAPWNTQIWFADRNFWMEHDEHRLPGSRYVQLGGHDATTWSPWLEWTLRGAPPVVFRYEGHFRGQEIDQGIELYESYFKLTYAVTRRWRLYSNTRWVRYDDAALAIDGGFVSTFAEVEYRFSPTISVALSFGVDPFVLDEVTNEYDEIGRNEFLIDSGGAPNVARDSYLNLSRLLPRAEQALEDERRIQLEAIVSF
ncbi:MAG: hypothetical protein ACE5G2_06120, partial [Candidatus Krumholzibacteriia bacterium]